MSSFVSSLAVWCIGSVAHGSQTAGVVSVRIEQQASGCFHSEERSHLWALLGDDFVWRERRLPRAEMEAVLRTIVGARREVSDLLEEVGVTPESVRANRRKIADIVTPERYWGKSGEAAVSHELDALLEWDRIAPPIRAELRGRNWGSTERCLLRATFTLDGRTVAVESTGLVPWMLPWKVTVDGYSFTSEDLAIPRTLRQLVDLEGPAARGLDGSSYWPSGFWSDERFWTRFVGRDLDRLLSEAEGATLPGWSAASKRFEVLDVETGKINLQPESMLFLLESKVPAAVDRARWHDFLVDGRPAQTWDDFLALYERAEACVRQQQWLLEWKALSPERRLQLEAAGTLGYSESMLDELVLPAWEDAGFPGRPELEIGMLDQGNGVGKIYLASGVHGCLIASAHLDRVLARRRPTSRSKDPALEMERPEQSVPAHWFDDLEFSYHPRGDPPTYGRVDAAGRVEVRTMTPVPLRGR